MKIVSPKKNATSNAGYTLSEMKYVTVSNDTFGFLSGPQVCFEYSIQRRRRNDAVRVHRPLHRRENVRELDLLLHKPGDCDFVRRVEHRRHRAARPPRLPGQPQRRELVRVRI